MDKYLRIEHERLWKKKTSVTSIVIGAFGAVSKKFSQYVDLLDLHNVKYLHLQRLALLGTTLPRVTALRYWIALELKLTLTSH